VNVLILDYTKKKQGFIEECFDSGGRAHLIGIKSPEIYCYLDESWKKFRYNSDN
jgi:hypothetical protein